MARHPPQYATNKTKLMHILQHMRIEPWSIAQRTTRALPHAKRGGDGSQRRTSPKHVSQQPRLSTHASTRSSRQPEQYTQHKCGRTTCIHVRHKCSGTQDHVGTRAQPEFLGATWCVFLPPFFFPQVQTQIRCKIVQGWKWWGVFFCTRLTPGSANFPALHTSPFAPHCR